jgi:DNA-binding Xre family transcriptional regulator
MVKIHWFYYTQGAYGMIRLRVKEVAKEKGIGQGKLARMSDIDVKTMQKIFQYPTSIVTTETLDRIAKALGVDASELIESVQDDT